MGSLIIREGLWGNMNYYIYRILDDYGGGEESSGHEAMRTLKVMKVHVITARA